MTPSESESSARFTGLLPYAQRVDDAGDALLVLGDELLVVVAAEELAGPAELLERRLPRRRLGRRLHQLHQVVALRRRDARRAEHAAPVAELDVDALLAQRRDALLALGRRHRERAHAPALDLLGEFAEAGHAAGDVAADDRRHRLAAALERDVVDAPR